MMVYLIGINTIYQARNGDIWIGTDKGLNRYNGVFERFRGLDDPVNIIFESSTDQLFARLYEPRGASGFGNVAISSLHFFDGLEWNDLDLLDKKITSIKLSPNYHNLLWNQLINYGCLPGMDWWDLMAKNGSYMTLMSTLTGWLRLRMVGSGLKAGKWTASLVLMAENGI